MVCAQQRKKIPKTILTFFFQLGSFSLFYQVVPFAIFLRFLDVFWITPILYKKESYVEASTLNNEFWSSVRVKPKNNKENEKQVAPVKDKVMLP